MVRMYVLANCIYGVVRLVAPSLYRMYDRTYTIYAFNIVLPGSVSLGSSKSLKLGSSAYSKRLPHLAKSLVTDSTTRLAFKTVVPIHVEVYELDHFRN